ncbi:HAD family hydrolase [Streptomyces sp. NBC_01619]|uniref:HAD family hydrolase n=1 Tax=Streptomyces pratisoli TaxID=3139917 RepID=A0ACC6QTV8_9ACTN|nr:HAD family hydrolase [Streptomyces sp. NBC_01619]MCX4515346.1 HAD family hydrolase [Streptomyces sp. NBC_01619]
MLLTGDAPEAAQVVADTLGITEVHAQLQLIRDLQGEGHTVAMVGDGTYDAPALVLAPDSALGLALASPATTCARSPPSSNSTGTHCASCGKLRPGDRRQPRRSARRRGRIHESRPRGPAPQHEQHRGRRNSARLVNHHLPRTTEELRAAPLEDRRVH